MGTSDEDGTWGAPQPQRWSMRQTLTAVGVAAVIAGLGGAAIYAATGNESHATGPGPGRWGGPGAPGGPGEPAALHGEFVVADANGGYVTQLTQTGVVTAVSDASITARSADGFTQTYMIENGAATGDVAVNDTVTIRATKAEGAVTATTLTEGDEPGGGPPHR